MLRFVKVSDVLNDGSKSDSHRVNNIRKDIYVTSNHHEFAAQRVNHEVSTICYSLELGVLAVFILTSTQGLRLHKIFCLM